MVARGKVLLISLVYAVFEIIMSKIIEYVVLKVTLKLVQKLVDCLGAYFSQQSGGFFSKKVVPFFF
jgi:hypothetical protein